MFGNCTQDRSSNKKWETEGVCSLKRQWLPRTRNVTSQCRGRSEVLPSLSIILKGLAARLCPHIIDYSNRPQISHAMQMRMWLILLC